MSVSGLANAQVFFMHMLGYAHWSMVIRMTWAMTSSSITATVCSPHMPMTVKAVNKVICTDSEKTTDPEIRRDARASLLNHGHSFAASMHRYLPAVHSLRTCWQTRS